MPGTVRARVYIVSRPASHWLGALVVPYGKPYRIPKPSAAAYLYGELLEVTYLRGPRVGFLLFVFIFLTSQFGTVIPARSPYTFLACMHQKDTRLQPHLKGPIQITPLSPFG